MFILGSQKDIPVRVVKDPDFRCKRCFGNAWAIDGKPCVEVQLSDGKLDVVVNICLSW